MVILWSRNDAAWLARSYPGVTLDSISLGSGINYLLVVRRPKREWSYNVCIDWDTLEYDSRMKHLAIARAARVLLESAC